MVDETSNEDISFSSSEKQNSDLELPPLPEYLVTKKIRQKGILRIPLFRKKAASLTSTTPRTTEPLATEAGHADVLSSKETIFPQIAQKQQPESQKKEFEFACNICNKRFDNKRALKIHMKQTHPGGIKYCLVLRTGDKIKNFEDLRHFIKYIDDDTYNYHTSQKNDFADWVENALQKKEMADKLRLAKKRVDAIRVLYGREIKPADIEPPAEERVEKKEEELEPVEDYSRFMPEEEKLALEQTAREKGNSKRRGILGIFRKKEKRPEEEKLYQQENLIKEEEKLEKELEIEKGVVGEEPEKLEKLEKTELSKEKGVEEIRELKKELDQKEREIKAKVEELLKDDGCLKAKEKELIKRANEIIREEKKLENKRKDIDKRIKRLEKIEEKTKAAQNKLNLYKKELGKREKELEKKKREIERSKLKKEELAEIRKILPKVSRDYSKKIREMERMEERGRRLREEYQKKMPGVKELEKKVKEREEHVKKKEQELEDKKNQLMDMQYRLLEEKNRLEEERFELYVKQELKKGEIYPENREFPSEKEPLHETEMEAQNSIDELPDTAFSGTARTRESAEGYIKKKEESEGVMQKPWTPKPEMKRETTGISGVIDFESAESHIRDMIQQQRFEEAVSLLQKLEDFNKKAKIKEADRRRQHYKILELKTDLKLAAIKQKMK